LFDFVKSIRLSPYKEASFFLLGNIQLTTRQIAALKALHRKQRDWRFADRVKAIVLLGSGWSTADVAQTLLIDEDTVRNRLEKYQHGGESELLAMHYQGKAPSLTCEQQDELTQHLDENTYLDSKTIRHGITSKKLTT
jgi:transposase